MCFSTDIIHTGHINIIKKAKDKILIIDNYINDSMLEMLSKKNKNVKVAILTSEKNRIQSTININRNKKIHYTRSKD